MNEPPTYAPTPQPSLQPTPAPAEPGGARRRLHLGPVPITLPLVVVVLVMLGSVAYILWVVARVRDDQIPLLAVGFVVLGASYLAIAVGSLVGMWRAASRARGGRALALAIVGGLAGLAAVGSFTVTALLTLVWNT